MGSPGRQTPGYRGTLDRRPRHSNVQHANQSPPPPPPQVPVLTIPAKNASKRKGSAAGGIGVAQASGQVLESLPAAVASRASPQAASFTQTAGVGGKKSAGKVHGGPGRPPAKTYESTDADMRGTRSITEFFGRWYHSIQGRTMEDAGITPFKDGQWKQYVETSFLPKGSLHLPRATSCMRCISYSRKMPS